MTLFVSWNAWNNTIVWVPFPVGFVLSLVEYAWGYMVVKRVVWTKETGLLYWKSSCGCWSDP